MKAIEQDDGEEIGIEEEEERKTRHDMIIIVSVQIIVIY